MAVGTEFRDFVLDLLAPLRPGARRMFGGVGIMRDGVMFALLADDTMYLRVDKPMRAKFEAEGCDPFCYRRADREVTIASYYAVPERLYDDPEALVEWAREAIGVALEVERSGHGRAPGVGQRQRRQPSDVAAARSRTDRRGSPQVGTKVVRPAEARAAPSFSLIGRFIYQFSQLEFTVRAVLGGMLKLTDAEFDVVTAPYDFRILCSVTRIILTQRFGCDEVAINRVFGKCLELNDQRVRIAHGTWADDGKRLSARYVARNTLTAQWFFEDADNLKRLTDSARKLMVEVLDLTRDAGG